MPDFARPARRQLLTGAASLLTLPLLGAGEELAAGGASKVRHGDNPF